jgi:DNA-binding IclR family transcriptional regulator
MPEALPPEDAYLSPPVQRATRLLRRIAEGDRVTNMSRTARDLDISRTTLLRLLHTLEAERFIEPCGEDGSGWRIGTALIGLAARAFASEDLAEAAQPILTRLAEALGLSAHLGVLDGREVVYMVRRTPNLSFASNIRVGSRLPAHAANMGRIILAHLPDAQVRRIYGEAPMPASTPHTPTTLDGLLARLAADRAEGLAWSDGHFEPGIGSVAAVVRDASGAPVAAINVSGQVGSFEGREQRARIGAAVAGAAAEISARLGFAGTPARKTLEAVA